MADVLTLNMSSTAMLPSPLDSIRAKNNFMIDLNGIAFNVVFLSMVNNEELAHFQGNKMFVEFVLDLMDFWAA